MDKIRQAVSNARYYGPHLCGDGCGKTISANKQFCWDCALLRKEVELPADHPLKQEFRKLLEQRGLTPLDPALEKQKQDEANR